MQRTRVMLLALAAIAALVVASVSVAAMSPTKLKASAALNVGQEKPKPVGTKLGASGRFTATVNGTSVTWTLTYKQLSGAALQAHIHQAARGKVGGVLVALCAPCSPTTKGTAALTADQVKAMKRGLLYVNVHTAKNMGGEIRGQISTAPMKK
jgi:LysM repeat protein